MSLSTFESVSIADLFVTTRALEAEATLTTVDRLAALRLVPLRKDYQVETELHQAFMCLVAAQITQRGYAVHGFDVAFERRQHPRHPIH